MQSASRNADLGSIDEAVRAPASRKFIRPSELVLMLPTLELELLGLEFYDASLYVGFFNIY